MLILSLPPVHQVDLLRSIIEHPLVGAVRYNTGVPSAYDPYETIKRIKALTEPLGKPFWVDLKAKQLRVVEWAVVPDSPIILNHKVKVELPAKVHLRGDESCELREVVDGNKLYVDGKPSLVGKGQSINILAKKLEIEGGLLDIDHEYIKAALSLGIKRFMLSFVECADDVRELEDAIVLHSRGAVSVGECEIMFKIESHAGVEFVRGLPKKHFSADSPYSVMAARDDLMIHIGLMDMPEALQIIAKKDPRAVCASRLLMGLEGGGVSMADLSDLEYMRSLGYKHFMFSDGISREQTKEALAFWEAYAAQRPF